MVEFKLAEFKMAAIIKLSQKKWVKFFCAKWLDLIWQNSIWLPSSSWVRMNEWSFCCAKWLNPRWLPSSSWVRMNDFESDWINWSQSFEQNGRIQDIWIQDGRIQDGCHHQVKWEWMTLSQIELVWVRVRMEWECFWVNLREDNKVSEFKMAVSESNMVEFKMAAIIKLSQNEWVKFFCANGGNQSWQVWVSLRGQTKMDESNMAKFKMAVFKMAAII